MAVRKQGVKKKKAANKDVVTLFTAVLSGYPRASVIIVTLIFVVGFISAIITGQVDNPIERIASIILWEGAGINLNKMLQQEKNHEQKCICDDTSKQ